MPLSTGIKLILPEIVEAEVTEYIEQDNKLTINICITKLTTMYICIVIQIINGGSTSQDT